MFCLRAMPSGSAMLRATVSVALPGPNGTTIVIGRDGYACASAIRDTAGSAAAPATRCRNLRRGNRMASSRTCSGPAGSGVDRRDQPSPTILPNPCLLRLDVGGLDYLAPGFELDLDALGELLGRAFDRIKIKRVQTLLHVRLRNVLDNLAMEDGDDLLRR